MDQKTISTHEDFVGEGNGSKPSTPTNLTPMEAAAFNYCLENNRRLEQEKILQSFVDRAFAALHPNAIVRVNFAGDLSGMPHSVSKSREARSSNAFS